MLGENGYEGVRIEEVARRSGTAKTSVYRRWPDRNALILAAVRFYFEAATGKSAGRERPAAATLRDDLLAHTRQLAALLSPERVRIIAGLLLAMQTEPALAAAVRATLSEGEGHAMTALLERAVRRGERQSAAVPGLVLHVMPAVLLMQLLVLGEPAHERFLTHLVDDVLLPLVASAPRPSSRRRRANHTL